MVNILYHKYRMELQIQETQMSEVRRDLIQALVTEQNRIACAGVPIDILTITGLMTTAEVEAHLAHCRAYGPNARAG